MKIIERAAKAVVGQRISEPGYDGDIDREDIATVMAVLQAIREPSDAMIDAWMEADLDLPEGVSAEGPSAIVDRYTARSDWQAMIDAALAEVPDRAAER